MKKHPSPQMKNIIGFPMCPLCLFGERIPLFHITTKMNISLGKGNFNPGPLELFKNRKVEGTSYRPARYVPDIDPDEKLKIEGTVGELDKPYGGLLVFRHERLPFGNVEQDPFHHSSDHNCRRRPRAAQCESWEKRGSS